MRGFTIAPENERILQGLAAWQTSGSLPTPGTPPTDPENAAFYQELVRSIAVIQAAMDRWKSQATYEGQSVYQAQQTMSTP